MSGIRMRNYTGMSKSMVALLVASISIISILFGILSLSEGNNLPTSDCPKCLEVKSEINEIERFIEKNKSLYHFPIENLTAQLYSNQLETTDPWGNSFHVSYFTNRNVTCLLIFSLGSNAVLGGKEEHQKDVFSSPVCKVKKVENNLSTRAK